MSNLLVEIGNTAVKAAWAEGMTLGKTFRYQGENRLEFILSLIRKDKPEVMVVSSVYPFSSEEMDLLEKECRHFLLLDKNHKELLLSHGLPSYLSYDRAASVLAARYLFRGMPCTIVDFGTTLSVDFTDKGGLYTRNQELDYLGIVRDNLLLEKLLRGAECVRILQRGPDHRA